MRTAFTTRWVAVAALALAGTVQAQQVVISQIYGGGNNTGAQYTHDFVELFNAGQTTAILSNWSVQYASSIGVTWVVSPIPSATIPAGGYYLIQQFGGFANGVPLPTPDLIPTTTFNMSGSTGKVALVKNTSPLGSATPLPDANIADFIGYGASPSDYEGRTSGGSPAPTLSNTTAAIRQNNGCQDSNNNGADFTVVAPMPRNSSSPLNVCPLVTNPTGSGGASPDPVFAGDSVTMTVLVTPGTNPTSTGITVTGNTTSIGGVASEAFTDNGNNNFSLTRVIPCLQALGTASIPITVADAQGRSSNFNLTFDVQDGTLVLGNAGAVPPDDGQPANATRCPGETAAFSARALGGGLTYQWFNGANIAMVNGPTGSGSTIAGATTPNLFITNVTVGDAAAGPYKCTITRACSSTSVSTNPAALTIGVAATAADKQIVISQVYGGGGNSGSLYTNDYIELFNKGAVPVNVTGWSVQYASSDAASTSANFDRPPRVTVLTGTIQPGQFFLIQEAAGSNQTGALPAPDVDGTAQANGGINLSAQGAKVALVKHSDPLAEICPYGNGGSPTACSIVDFVGWNPTTSCAEGGNPAAATGNATALMRISECVDTNNNGNDFVVAAPLAHNSASAISPTILTQPSSANTCVGLSATFTVLADGPCLHYQWEKNPQPENTGFVPVGTDSPTFTIASAVAADDDDQYRVTVTNAYGPPAVSNIVTVDTGGANAADQQIVIASVYGGGGNAGAIYQNDYVELFNKGTTPVSVDGWSLQYAAATGSGWSSNKTNLSGTILPGQYYLIALGHTSPGGCAGPTYCGIPLPAANVTNPSIDMSGNSGKLALLKTTDGLPAVACPSDCRIVDFVGYGSANCFEGANPAPSIGGDASKALNRVPVCSDTNVNLTDFAIGAPTPHAAATAVAADLNDDGRVDAGVTGAGNDDLDIFMACQTRDGVAYDPNNLPAGCTVSKNCNNRIRPDYDGDGDVDLRDYAVQQRCYSGSAPQTDVNCGN